jgi:ligand-binding sensor domain-containing protein
MLIGEDSFLIGTANGLVMYSLKDDEFIESYSIKELDYIAVQSIDNSKTQNTYWIGTEDSGFFLLKTKGNNESYEIINIGEKYEIGYENVQSILEDDQKILWVSTNGKGVFKLMPDKKVEFTYSDIVNYSTSNGLPYDFIKTIYQDWEGNYWIATYGKGLAFSVDEAFTFHYKDIDQLNGNILSIAESESTIWLGGEKVIAKVDKASNKVIILNAQNGIPNDKIVALYLDINQNLWIGSEIKGIYQLNTKSDRASVYYKSNNSLGNKINSITGNDNTVWVGTENGVLVYDLKTGQSELYNTAKGLPHNNIRFVYLDSENNPWIATKSKGIFVLDTDIERGIEGDINMNLQFSSITEDINGDIWAVTDG